MAPNELPEKVHEPEADGDPRWRDLCLLREQVGDTLHMAITELSTESGNCGNRDADLES